MMLMVMVLVRYSDVLMLQHVTLLRDANTDDGSCVYAPMGYTCDGGCDLAGGYLGITLVANDSYGDGWNGNVASVYFDGVLYDPLGVGLLIH